MNRPTKRRGPRPSKYKVVFWEALPKSTQKPVGEILEAIDNLVKQGFISINRRDGSEVETLSMAVAELPSYMKGLGYWLAEAENEVNFAKDAYELLKAQREKVLMGASSVAQAEREVATDDEVILLKDKFRKAQHNHRILKLQWDATDRQIDGWRSRLATVRREVMEGV